MLPGRTPWPQRQADAKKGSMQTFYTCPGVSSLVTLAGKHCQERIFSTGPASASHSPSEWLHAEHVLASAVHFECKPTWPFFLLLVLRELKATQDDTNILMHSRREWLLECVCARASSQPWYHWWRRSNWKATQLNHKHSHKCFLSTVKVKLQMTWDTASIKRINK